MALETSAPAPTAPLLAPPAARRGRTVTAALFLVGGLLMAAGGALHPHGSGSTVEAHLLSMFASPGWPLAHWVLLAGGVAGFLAFTAAWRTEAFDPRVRRWLPVAVAGWGFGALELVPHLLAAGEAHELAHHEATPVLDAHVVMQVVASPAVGLTGALIAVLVARAARTRAAWALAVLAVVGGVASAGAGPLTVLAHDPRFTVLFPFQAGLALWLLGTGIRLLGRDGRADSAA
jgi:hypothetical protein